MFSRHRRVDGHLALDMEPMDLEDSEPDKEMASSLLSDDMLSILLSLCPQQEAAAKDQSA